MVRSGNQQRWSFEYAALERRRSGTVRGQALLLSEMHNRTVHAALLMALAETEAGSRFYLAVYVCKGGWITPVYMALIDPFRRWIVYPALLKNIRAIWAESCALKGPEQKGRS